MNSVTNFLQNLNVQSLISLVMSVVTALLCITLHEMSHGYAALLLGDPTAKRQGRLSLNPVKHIDPFGLLLMIVARVGWAKPVPIDSRYFKNPKRDIAITAMAGPACNLVLSYVALLLGSLLYHQWYLRSGGIVAVYAVYFCVRVAVLSIGLCLFNLIPISPLDGSKVLFALLPQRIYYRILQYERYGMLLVLALVFFGVLDTPLSVVMGNALSLLCKLSGFPTAVMNYFY